MLVHPPVGLSTGRVFENCQPGRSGDPEPLVEALEKGSRRALLDGMHNSLQVTASGLEPWIGRLEEMLRRSGCLGFQMSGSGTSFFGICGHREHARQVASRLRSWQPGRVDCATTIHRWALG